MNGIPLQYLDGIGSYGNDIIDIVTGADLNGLGLGDAVSDEQMIYNHILKTRDAIVRNPAMVAAIQRPADMLRMYNYAIDNWHTPNRDKALDILAEEERRLQASGAILYGIDVALSGLGELGLYGFWDSVKKGVQKAGSTLKQGAKIVGQKVAQGAKTVARAIATYNPISLAIRAGFLVAVRLNFNTIASKCYPGILTQQEAAQGGVNANDHAKAIDAYKKIEQMYVKDMNGSVSTLKKAITSGAKKKWNKGILMSKQDIERAAQQDSAATQAAAQEDAGMSGFGSAVLAAGSAASVASATPFIVRATDLTKQLPSSYSIPTPPQIFKPQIPAPTPPQIIQMPRPTPPQSFKPQIPTSTPPQSFKPQMPRPTPPQSFKPQMPRPTPPQSFKPQIPTSTPPQSFKPQTPSTPTSSQSFKDGFLTAVRLNFNHIASKCYPALLSPEDAEKRGTSRDMHQRAAQALRNIELMFINELNGNASEFREAITEGARAAWNNSIITTAKEVESIVNQLSSSKLRGFGEAVVAAGSAVAVASATPFIVKATNFIKALFQKEEVKQFIDAATSAGAEQPKKNIFSKIKDRIVNAAASAQQEPAQEQPQPQQEANVQQNQDNNLTTKTMSDESTAMTNPNPSFLKKHGKKIAIAAVVAVVAGVGIYALTRKKKPATSSVAGLNGTRRRRKKSTTSAKRRVSKTRTRTLKLK